MERPAEAAAKATLFLLYAAVKACVAAVVGLLLATAAVKAFEWAWPKLAAMQVGELVVEIGRLPVGSIVGLVVLVWVLRTVLRDD